MRSRALLFVFSCLAALTFGASAASSVSSAGAKTKFVSKLYAYSIVLGGGAKQWQASFAIVAWSVGVIDPGLPAFDTLTEIQTQRAYVIGARRLPAGSTLTRWTSVVASNRPPHCLAAPTSRSRTSTLSGAAARVFTFSCTDGFRVQAITALHAQHGYFMFVASPTGLSVASDQSAFVAARRSFRFARK